MQVVSVVPDVTGLDRVFDYEVPSELGVMPIVGDLVRVPLHGRNVRGWVVEVSDSATVDASKIKPIVAVISKGPTQEVVELAAWTARRWCGRWRSVLVAATAQKLVRALPAPRRSSVTASNDQALAVFDHPRTVVVRRGPKWDVAHFVRRIHARGPVLVVAPTVGRASALRTVLRAAGLTVALYPDDWANAAAGVDVTIGARSAVFASVPNLASVVVVDEHDDALQESRNPTWHARDVAVERARRAAIPCFLLSPIPSVSAIEFAGRMVDVVESEPDQWPNVEIVDRTQDEHWADSLVSSRLVELVRDGAKRVVVVLNVKGRSRLLACASCRTLTRCAECGGAVQEHDDGLTCARCASSRPKVCLVCASTSLRNLRPGVKRLGDDLLKASGRDDSALCVVEEGRDVDQRASLFVGTEAAIHRVRRPDVVVFADFDQELFAARFRASEIASGLIIAAARQVEAGLVVVQTHAPDHVLMRALRDRRFDDYAVAESTARRELSLPPFSVTAALGGKRGSEVAHSLAAKHGLPMSGHGEGAVLRFRDAQQMIAVLEDAATGSESMKDVRIHVDPPRL
ncbi:MAG: putative primosomal protein n [Actinomycetota bacterium]